MKFEFLVLATGQDAVTKVYDRCTMEAGSTAEAARKYAQLFAENTDLFSGRPENESETAPEPRRSLAEGRWYRTQERWSEDGGPHE